MITLNSFQPHRDVRPGDPDVALVTDGPPLYWLEWEDDTRCDLTRDEYEKVLVIVREYYGPRLTSNYGQVPS